jgi:hypothetical protein
MRLRQTRPLLRGDVYTHSIATQPHPLAATGRSVRQCTLVAEPTLLRSVPHSLHPVHVGHRFPHFAHTHLRPPRDDPPTKDRSSSLPLSSNSNLPPRSCCFVVACRIHGTTSGRGHAQTAAKRLPPSRATARASAADAAQPQFVWISSTDAIRLANATSQRRPTRLRSCKGSCRTVSATASASMRSQGATARRRSRAVTSSCHERSKNGTITRLRGALFGC